MLNLYVVSQPVTRMVAIIMTTSILCLLRGESEHLLGPKSVFSQFTLCFLNMTCRVLCKYKHRLVIVHFQVPMQEEAWSNISQLSQLEMELTTFEGGCLPPPNRFKKNSSRVPLNEEVIRCTQAYKMVYRREIARKEYDECWNKSSMYRICEHHVAEIEI